MADFFLAKSWNTIPPTEKMKIKLTNNQEGPVKTLYTALHALILITKTRTEKPDKEGSNIETNTYTLYTSLIQNLMY